ncbi:Uncharacterised protein [Mycoplasmopsis maculosa]|uniref:Uncharacterized protein n=1 Tax=Mycoplasmopsis maculosa TaxID=114885 RepID=A0A449B4U1_9BACT|nr:hypothetical protein [Mycoplasmopsis maculosa]VEU75585.1 Uncharacterised protein [Mycoplasmopsis maculosa]
MGQSGVMGNTAMWIVLAVLIVLLVAIFTYSVIKDKIKKRKRAKEEKLFKEKSLEQAKLIFIQLDALKTVNDKYLDEFEVSIGKFKMMQLLRTATKYLDTIQNNEDFKDYVINSKDNENKVLKIFLNFYQNKSNNWSKTCVDSLKEINKFKKEISEYEYNELFNDFKIKIDEFYKKELYEEVEPTK